MQESGHVRARWEQDDSARNAAAIRILRLGEAVTGQDRLSFGGKGEVHESLAHGSIAAGGGYGNGIGDRLMARERQTDIDLVGTLLGISGVDDAGIDFHHEPRNPGPAARCCRR